MFAFSVYCFWAVVGATLAENYFPVEEHPYYTYNTEYAPEYNNYEPKGYHFQYAVSDPHTGDHKSQWEVKEKGVVRGMYSLLEPDGTTRVVEYVADENGFRAVVKKLGTAVHPQHHEEALVRLPEAYNNGYSGAYSGLGENYGLGTIVVPTENYGTGSLPISVENYDTGSVVVPVEVANHGSSVEIHGYTGNADDDSSYTNYDHGNAYDNNANVYYQPNLGHQHYYEQPKPQAPIPYTMSYNGPTYWG